MERIVGEETAKGGRRRKEREATERWEGGGRSKEWQCRRRGGEERRKSRKGGEGRAIQWINGCILKAIKIMVRVMSSLCFKGRCYK